jgi:RNA polymerase sigma-70 factor (ECF subfamily)
VPDLAALPDTDLVALARRMLAEPGGKPTADRCIAIVFERHAALVRAILGAKMPSSKLDDASQQVWLRFWTKIAAGSEVVRSPPGLLVRIARFVVADVTAAAEPPGPELHDESAAVGDGHAEVERADLVERLLALLPERQRHVVVLRILQDRPSAEVAAMLGTTPGNIDVILHRALEAMRKAAP